MRESLPRTQDILDTSMAISNVVVGIQTYIVPIFIGVSNQYGPCKKRAKNPKVGLLCE